MLGDLYFPFIYATILLVAYTLVMFALLFTIHDMGERLNKLEVQLDQFKGKRRER